MQKHCAERESERERQRERDRERETERERERERERQRERERERRRYIANQPLYSAKTPSCRMVFVRQSNTPLYSPLASFCIPAQQCTTPH